MNYYISDLHFGQDTICQREGRPFRDVEEMDRVLIERWNSRVSMDDIVYVVGDFILRGEEYWGEYLDKLKGRIVLLRGNHDPESFSAETRSETSFAICSRDSKFLENKMTPPISPFVRAPRSGIGRLVPSNPAMIICPMARLRDNVFCSGMAIPR